MVPVPLTNIGPVSAGSTGAQNVSQTYTLTLVKGDRRTGTATPITNATTGSTTFAKPLDNIGNKSIANYAAYAGTFVYPITSIPGCAAGQGKVFVGQRQDPFFLDLGGTFDLVNYTYPVTELVPAGTSPRNYATNSLAGFNVTTLALEIPAAVSDQWLRSGHRRLTPRRACDRPLCSIRRRRAPRASPVSVL